MRACEYSVSNTCRQVFKSFSCHEKISCYRDLQNTVVGTFEHCNDSANQEQNRMNEFIFYAEVQPIFALAKVFEDADSTKQSKTFFRASKIFYQTDFQQVFIRFNRINTKLFLSSIINRHINTILSIAPNSSRSEDLKQAYLYFHFITIFLPLVM